MKIIASKPEHLSELAAIYNYYVRNTTVTFNLRELSEEQFGQDFYNVDELSGIYTIFEDNLIIGFGCLSRFNKKEAYDRSAYVSIYLNEESIGMGLGGRILIFLEKAAYKKGIRSLIALVCKENLRSIALFMKNGYKFAGELTEAAEKFGRLLDVVYYQKNI